MSNSCRRSRSTIWKSEGKQDLTHYPRPNGCPNHLQRIDTARSFALFKVALALRHLVGYVGKADDGFAAGLGEGVKRGSFHLHRQDPGGVGLGNRSIGFAKGRICGLGVAPVDGPAQMVEGA
jgi:hypothetical protein